MAKIIPVPGVTGNTDSNEFGSDSMVADSAFLGGNRAEYNTAPFIPFSEDTFASESDSGNKVFGGGE